MARQSNAALMAELNRLKLEVHSLKTEQGTEISVGNYLLTRLEQLGVTNIFGVPGDFNLGFLVNLFRLLHVLVWRTETSYRTSSRIIQTLSGSATGTSHAIVPVDKILSYCSNELNAAYAADGYARVKDHSIGVVLTTCIFIA
ncbi:hypothetical protein H0H87_004641 [Tephrocybe sp. NHM501043]|nr:hypothetical protein H0H87_004641 [Tephrocybe sp. NHM501043]